MTKLIFGPELEGACIQALENEPNFQSFSTFSTPNVGIDSGLYGRCPQFLQTGNGLTRLHCEFYRNRQRGGRFRSKRLEREL
ncbi:hypothetical protein SAMN03080617_03463 [Algoriphagus alkaliphilus]|uniref:Uncharacterized protein n=1 Tax=Algoriphagus alkaliphilus TaxID=279824 RepID=A0A1G5ZAN7_9BACT|nr:hypothetical protein SAMN03080617_03463 [Algoriphagus alkaliphilus]